MSCCSCLPKPRHGASTDHRSRPVLRGVAAMLVRCVASSPMLQQALLRGILRDLVTWVTTVRQAFNCGQSCGLASSTSTINDSVKFPLGSWGTGLMWWDSLSDAGRPSGGGASRFGMRRGLLGGQLLARPRADLSTRCCSRRLGRSRLRNPTSRNPYGKNLRKVSGKCGVLGSSVWNRWNVRKHSGFLIKANNSKTGNARVIREPADRPVTTLNRGYLGTPPVVCRDVEAPRSWS